MAALGAALVALGCGSSPGEEGEPAEPDDSWAETPPLGKADGTSPETVAARKAFTAQFAEPALDEAEQQEVLGRYATVDVGGVAPRALLERALVYYDVNQALLENPRYVALIDFSQHSSKRRFYLVDMQSGEVETHVVAHGSGSDSDNDGVATEFSNVVNSHQSSLGFYLTAETYSGSWGRSLRLDGLSASNSNVRLRAIVMHGASYVVDGKAKQGRSWGCPAVPTSEKDAIIDKVRGGSLMYADR